MPWVRIDENFPDHPKSCEAGALGRDLQVCALTYCNRHLTDGFISKSALPKIADFSDVLLRSDDPLCGPDQTPSPKAVSDRLVSVGMWHVAGHDCPECPEVPEGTFYIHDYVQYQPTKRETLDDQRERASRYRAGGRARASTAKRDQQGRYVSAGQVQRDQQGTQRPAGDTLDPAHQQASSPDPTRTGINPGTSKTVGASAPSDYPDDFESFWTAYPTRPNNPKKPAFAKWRARLKAGASPESLIAAAEHYAAYCDREGTEARFIAQAKTWLNQARDEEFASGVPPPSESGEPGYVRDIRDWLEATDDEGGDGASDGDDRGGLRHAAGQAPPGGLPSGPR